MPKFGIVLYNIEADGSLNGVYTNETVHGEIFNEIGRKKIPPQCFGDIAGDYDSFYFEPGNLSDRNSGFAAELSIKKIQTNVYDFEWKLNGSKQAVFNGIGYKMNEKQIAVRYESIP
jgi:hypothetical protein